MARVFGPGRRLGRRGPRGGPRFREFVSQGGKRPPPYLPKRKVAFAFECTSRSGAAWNQRPSIGGVSRFGESISHLGLSRNMPERIRHHRSSGSIPENDAVGKRKLGDLCVQRDPLSTNLYELLEKRAFRAGVSSEPIRKSAERMLGAGSYVCLARPRRTSSSVARGGAPSRSATSAHPANLPGGCIYTPGVEFYGSPEVLLGVAVTAVPSTSRVRAACSSGCTRGAAVFGNPFGWI